MTVLELARRICGVDAMEAMVHAQRAVLPRVSIGCPANLLHRRDVADWSRNSGTFVNARIDELELAASAGVRPNQLILHVEDCSPEPIRHAANLGIRRFAVDTPDEARALARYSHRPTFALLNLTGAEFIPTMAALLDQHRVTVVGAHADSIDAGDLAGDVDQMLAHTATIRTRYGILLSRISFAVGSLDDWVEDLDAVRRRGVAIDDALSHACLRHRVPRPSVALAPAS